MEGQWSRVVAWNRYILVNAGQAIQTYFGAAEFADDIVRGNNCRKRAIFENWSDALFVNLDQCGWAWSPLFVG